MKLALDPAARAALERAKLRFTCEDCAYFDPEREQCAHGYPTREHRREVLDRGLLVFCKEWELV